mgnify:CR=1 FL=1
MFSEIFNYDNRFWRFMGKLWDALVLNILWVVCCIPLVTVGAATTAVYYVALKLARDEEGYVISSFFKSFKENFRQATALWLVLAAVVLMLVPMLLVARYNVPCADDYHFGAPTHAAWQATHSLAAVVKAAGEKVAERYANWQGTYSAMFLMALQPAVFGNGFYALVPFLTLGMLAAGTCFFCLSLFTKLLGASRWQALVLALVWLGIDTQLLPSAVQGFYWYNGAIFYTFFFGVQLFYFGLLARYVAARHAARRRSAAFLTGLCALGLFLGGGNLVTAFGTLLVLVCVLCLLAIMKSRQWRALLLPLAFFWQAFW